MTLTFYFFSWSILHQSFATDNSQYWMLLEATKQGDGSPSSGTPVQELTHQTNYIVDMFMICYVFWGGFFVWLGFLFGFFIILLLKIMRLLQLTFRLTTLSSFVLSTNFVLPLLTEFFFDNLWWCWTLWFSEQGLVGFETEKCFICCENWIFNPFPIFK